MSLLGQDAAASQVIQSCLDRKIKVLAFDFDLTIVDIHTQGAWMGSADTLALHVQPWAKVLMYEILQRSDMCMCIVTFSSQPLLIRNVLRKCYPDNLAKINRMAVCANTGLQCVPYFTNSDDTKGKNCHLGLALDHIHANDNMTVAPKNVILLDDDANNVRTAMSQGYRGCIVTENFSLQKLLTQLKKIPAAAAPEKKTMSNGEKVQLVCCVSASVLALMAVLSCMLGHAGGIVIFKGSTDIQLGLWTLDIDGNQSYDLDFGKELNLIPEVYRAAFELEQSDFQSKCNSARVFLLLSHFSAVVSLFSFVWFQLDIFHGTKGAVTLVGVNFAHVVLLLISCACLASGYQELASIEGPGWSGVLIWVGFALSLLCLVISLVVVVADKLSSSSAQQRQSYNADGDEPVAVASSNGSPRSVPDQQPVA